MSLHRDLIRMSLDDAGTEEPAATRERLRDHFPRGATRRMTQLGLLLGHVLLDLEPTADDTIIYASRFGETRALEAYLESFPAASPTLFQTSIQPSGVQQVLIGRQQPLREFWPVTGHEQLVAQALTCSLLAPSRRVILCGGEERGTWLLEQGVASARSFAFALALEREALQPLARLRLVADAAADHPALSLEGFFDSLQGRTPWLLAAPAGGVLSWTWA